MAFIVDQPILPTRNERMYSSVWNNAQGLWGGRKLVIRPFSIVQPLDVVSMPLTAITSSDWSIGIIHCDMASGARIPSTSILMK